MKPRIKIAAGLLVVVAGLIFFSQYRPEGAGSKRLHPARELRTHALAGKPLAERVGMIPPDVLDYLLKDSALNGYPITARPHAMSNAERAIVKNCLGSLPAEVRDLAARYVVGMYFVTELGTSAFGEFLDPPDRQTFLVFDAMVLHERSNAWATRKERSGFVESADVRLEIADPEKDVVGGGFRFIFLHELGHALAHGLRLLPSWLDEGDHAFPYIPVLGDWQVSQPSVHFYAPVEKQLARDRVPRLYAQWHASSAPTLSASVSPHEDFAETFASYVHVITMGEPYRLFIGSKQYGNGIVEPRCEKKRAFMASWFGP